MIIKKNEKVKLKVEVIIEVYPIHQEMTVEDLIDEFSTETEYDFSDTSLIRVFNTEFRECMLT